MYEIKVLSNEEFDRLPISETRGSDITKSLGFANKFTGKAYVRQTGTHELNKYLISHELEELESEQSTHEDENGIRHKSFGSFFKSFLPQVLGLIPEFGPYLSTGFQAINAFNQADKQNQFQQQQAPPGGENIFRQLVEQRQQQSNQPQQQQQFSGSPMGMFGSPSNTPSNLGLSNVQSPGSSRVPESLSGVPQSVLGGGLGTQNISVGQNLNPELRKRVSGFYSGRTVF